MVDYDEDAELDRYVWEHHSALFTKFELRVWRAHLAALKAVRASEEMARWIRSRIGAEDDPEVKQALAHGWPLFRSTARARVMRDHPDAIVVNRCPACSRIVRTPLAQQCLWCGADWHRA